MIPVGLLALALMAILGVAGALVMPWWAWLLTLAACWLFDQGVKAYNRR